MTEGEQLVAEQIVLFRDQAVTVRISQHAVEEFWRVQVTNPATPRPPVNTTVGSGDSFLMYLIQEAVAGQAPAWHQLAQWGLSNMTRPSTGFRSALA